MNCKKVEELLPLYVGRDLEEERAGLVREHMRSCTQCARSIREYGEATQLLQLFEPPQFSEATYAAVRSRVLREIERDSSAPQSIFALEFLRRPFQARIMWAVSTAVLLFACMFAYYFIANRTNGPQQRAETPGSGEIRDERTNGAPQPDKSKSLPAPSGNNILAALPGTGDPTRKTATRLPNPRFNQTVSHSRRPGAAPAVPITRPSIPRLSQKTPRQTRQ